MKIAIQVVVALLLVVLLGALFSWPVMWLWNENLPTAIDGFHKISWMQAWGILILCGFLFKPSSD